MTDNTQKIKDALLTLDVKDDSQWTNDGLPAMKLIQDLTGIKNLKRGELTAAAPTFTRENPSFEAPTPEKALENPEAPTSGQSDEPEDVPVITQVVSIAVPEDVTEADTILAKAEEVLAEAQKVFDAAQKKVASALAARDAIIEANAKLVNPHQNQLDIMAFLESQRNLREQRVKNAMNVTTTVQAPIDRAMARKTGFGIQRPALPLKSQE